MQRDGAPLALILRGLALLSAATSSTTAAAAAAAAAGNSAAHAVTPDTAFYQQALDHFDPRESRRWPHRYLSSAHYWDGRGTLPNGCKGPVLLYTGNEGAIDGFWIANGFMIDVLAPQWGAFLLFPESRYYGESLPFGNATFNPADAANNLQYLSTAQILADYAELVQHVKATTPGMENCPVVAFGGSYGGTLTTLMRLTYPNVVIGGLASSAPVGYYDSAHWGTHGVDEYTWAGIVSKDYGEAHPQCLSAIESARVAIEAAPVPELVAAFGVCEPAGLGPTATSDLFLYVLESMPQLDYPMAIGSLPAWPVNATCDALVKVDASDPKALINAAAGVVHMLMGTGTPHAADSFAYHHQQQCEIVDGWDLWGNDLLGPDGKPAPQPVADPGACCDMCAAKPVDQEPKGPCRAWSFNHGTKMCWMKSQNSSRPVQNGDTSGVVVGGGGSNSSSSSSNCIPTAAEGPGGVPGDGPGGISAWSYQSCTETLHLFSSKITAKGTDAWQGIRNFAFDLENWAVPLCDRLFNGTVTPDPQRLAREFGGYLIGDNPEGVTNLIWSNGGMDPWHGGGFYPGDKPGAAGMGGQTHVQRGSNHYIWIQRGAHHGDLRSPSPGDPEELTAARTLETQIIAGWIQAAGRV